MGSTVHSNDALYQFVQHLGYRNVQEVLKDMSHREFIHKRRIYDEQLKQQKAKSKLLASQNFKKKKGDYVEELAIKLEKCFNDIKTTPNISFSKLRERHKVTLAYLQALSREKILINQSKVKANPYWVSAYEINDYVELAHNVRQSAYRYIKNTKSK